jgi:hypothetical protein
MRTREAKAKALQRMKPKHRVAFLAWYECDRNCVKTRTKLAGTIDVCIGTLERWCKQYDWHERANVMDNEAERRAAADSVRRKAEMVKRHANIGQGMQAKAVEYLKEHGVDNGAQAVTAAKVGIDIERTAEGLPAWIVDIMGMSDDDAEAEYNRLVAGQADTGAAGEAGSERALDAGSLAPTDTGNGD